MENFLISNSNDFYNKYHDSFLIEIDADIYAATQLIQDYGEKYCDIVSDIVNNELMGRKRINSKEFYLMELEAYKRLKQQEQIKLHK